MIPHSNPYQPCSQKPYPSPVVESAASIGKRLCYTSFDGDHMHEVDLMCDLALRMGYVPINPEAALGYYVSTMAHGGEKIEVMRDCIALELACDEFWLFHQPGLPLAEGVVAELRLWQESYPDRPVRYLPCLSQGYSTSSFGTPDFPQIDPFDPLVNQLLSDFDQSFLADIDTRLNNSVKSGSLRNLVFVSQNPNDLKHNDWARVYVYDHQAVPLSPDTLLRYYVSASVYGQAFVQQHLVDRQTLMNVASELWILDKSPEAVIAGEGHSLQSADLDYWTESRAGPVRAVSWRDAEVPKFVRPKWSLTQLEQSKHIDAYAHVS